MYDCIVVGGGVIGLMTAYELSTSGLNVAVIERAHPGQEASWAGGGILFPISPWDYPPHLIEMVKWSQIAYPRICRNLTEISGVDPECIQSGLLYLDSSQFQKAVDWNKKFNFQFSYVGEIDIKQNFPFINRAKNTSGILMPEILQVRNPRFIKALSKALKAIGTTILPLTQAHRITTSQNRVTGVVTQNDMLKANSVVVSCGAWSNVLVDEFNSQFNISPVKGQMLLFKNFGTPNP